MCVIYTQLDLSSSVWKLQTSNDFIESNIVLCSIIQHDLSIKQTSLRIGFNHIQRLIRATRVIELEVLNVSWAKVTQGSAIS